MEKDTHDLLLCFQKMGTTDHDVLIKQLQSILCIENEGTCKFFLEAYNWNVQVFLMLIIIC